jgi:hypothetical protein
MTTEYGIRMLAVPSSWMRCLPSPFRFRGKMRDLIGKDMYQWNWKCEGPVNRKRIEDPLMHYYASLPFSATNACWWRLSREESFEWTEPRHLGNLPKQRRKGYYAPLMLYGKAWVPGTIEWPNSWDDTSLARANTPESRSSSGEESVSVQ